MLLQLLPPQTWAYTSATILLINISQQIKTDLYRFLSTDSQHGRFETGGLGCRQGRSFAAGFPVRASFLGSNTTPNKQEGMPSKTYAQE
jgi:hypothetical protein